jgi:hypothetical protein
MQRLRLAAAVAAFSLLAGVQTAGAGTLSSASLTLVLGTLPPAVFSASGLSGMGNAEGTGGTATWLVGAGAVPGGTVTTPVTALPFVTVFQVIVSGNPGGAAFAAGVPGGMPVTGNAYAKGFGGVTLLTVPLSIGTPGTQMAGAGFLAVTVVGDDWTTGTASVPLTTPTSMGATMATAMGANFLVGGGGTLVMVSALNVLTAAAGQIPGFAILTLNFVPSAPEPAGLALLGMGVAGLLAAGLSRVR